MAVLTKRPSSGRRIWKAPPSRARWYWLAASIILYSALFVWYIQALKTQRFPGPFFDPLRLFGIIAFILVLGTAAYSLRRRFVRNLPGKVQSWLWMHTWVGVSTILIALLHENFAYITHDYCQNLTCLTDTYWAGGALFSLILLVISGITGRLLDTWQTSIIAHEASTNGVGIVQALQERILALEYTIERLCAGKSDLFKQFCSQALSRNTLLDTSPAVLPPLTQLEHTDFQRACETLNTRAHLVQSLHRQQRARWLMRIWRTAHMILAILALITISYHAIMELLTNVWHLLPAA